MTYARRTDRKAHKFNAKPTVVDGIRFASQKEAKRYGELKLLQQAGEIKHLELQPKFPLWVWSNPIAEGDEPVEVGRYIADFRYYDVKRGCKVVEDVKGMRTPLYRLKKKMAEAQYIIEIREV